jgi:hypothetical protein
VVFLIRGCVHTQSHILNPVKIYRSRDKKSPKKAIPLSIINFRFLKLFLEINGLNQTIFLGIKIALILTEVIYQLPIKPNHEQSWDAHPLKLVGGPLFQRWSRRGKPRVQEETKKWFLTFS